MVSGGNRKMEKANTVGDKIRLLRKKNKLTQQQLAELIGVSAISIRKYESGDRQPSQTTLKVIADVFKVKPGIFNDVLELSLTNISEYCSNYTYSENQQALINKANLSMKCIDMAKILDVYSYTLKDGITPGTVIIEGNGIKIESTKEDILDLKTYLGFALDVKLKELESKSTKEGE